MPLDRFPDAASTESTDGSAQGGRAWALRPVEAGAAELARSAGIPAIIATLLWQREIRTPVDASDFFAPNIDHLHASSGLLGIETAVQRIADAIRRREPMLIYGDYDVDGTLATVLLKTAIDRITPKGIPSLVGYHVPHRIREGCGMQAGILADAAASGVRLVISVDTGIRAFAAADEATALGLDLIVTDHHLPEGGRLPQAVAVINPNQPGCSYPEKGLCGAAVAYKLAEALLESATAPSSDFQAIAPASMLALRTSLLKLVAIATVADAVPLTGENRTIAAVGLAALRSVRQPGLRALLRLAEVEHGESGTTAQNVAFRVAPRINAAGRMDVASDVVQLLLTRDNDEAERLALKLHTLNDARRSVEADVFREISHTLDAQSAQEAAPRSGVVVVDGEGWHRGVVGILASRVVEKRGCPALVITHEEGAAHGSGRSVEGFHLLNALTAAHDEHHRESSEALFLRFGGHAQAVGFSLFSHNVPHLRERLARHTRGRVSAEPAALRVDAELSLDAVDPTLWQWLTRMEPFGSGNEEPVFCCYGLTVLAMTILKERHMKLRLRTTGGRTVECVCWARTFAWPDRLAAAGIVPGSLVDIAYQVRWRVHPEFGGLQFTAADVRLANTERHSSNLSATQTADVSLIY